MSERRGVPGHTRRETHTEQEHRASVTPGGTERFLVLIVLSLTALSLLGQLVVHLMPDFVGRDRFAAMFNLDSECNIPTLYQTLALLGCAGGAPGRRTLVTALEAHVGHLRRPGC
jgi:hypothetical protein